MAVLIPDHYTTLGVHPKAPLEVIQASYRALAKLYQTDKLKMQAINDAYEKLDKSRKEYDASLVEGKGKIIGDYRIIKEIASGGFGITYLAEHRILKVPVCIKHTIECGIEDEHILLEEARAVWDFRHWGIPAMRDILRMPDKSLALVMSYVPGPTLAQIIEKHKKGLDPEHVAWIIERCLNTLKYLHMHGCVHGDIKPQNIIIQPESHTVTIVDYGLSRVRPSAKTEAKGYTPYYAAPEQIAGTVPIPQTDLFGLGMTMVFALGGDVETVKVPDNVPKEMLGLLKRLVRREPLQRPDVWKHEDLCETIAKVRAKDFGRTASAMKPLNL